MRYLAFILVLLVGMSSCDTREDWFEMNSDFPDLIVDINGKIDTIRQGDSRKIVVNLKTTRVKSGSIFFTDTVNLKMKGIGEKGKFPLHGAQIYGARISGGKYSEDCNENELYMQLYHVFGDDEYTLFNNDSSACLLETLIGQIYMLDMFANEQYYTIEINIYGPIPPTPLLKAEKLAGEYEYSLSLEDSYDRDGKVTKYEWCIDGNIVPYSVTDFRFESKTKGNWKSGQAAYGGTYITETSLSRINHSFQTAGEHTVYYRCMDNMGLWSMWYSKKINVE